MTDDKTRPGMVPAEEWAQTDVHRASSYSCAKCGQEFDSPEAVYDHLDEAHPKGAQDAND